MPRTALLLAALLCTAVAAHAADEKPAIKPGWTELPDQVDKADGIQPKIEKLVSEDELTRVEETRVGGVTKKVIVHQKKIPLPDYEILVTDSHYALAANRIGNHSAGREGLTGVSVWRLFEY